MNVITFKGLEFHQLHNLDNILRSEASGGDFATDIAFLKLSIKVIKAMLRITENCKRIAVQHKYCQDDSLRERISKRFFKARKSRLSLTIEEMKVLRAIFLRVSTDDIISNDLVSVHQELLSFTFADSLNINQQLNYHQDQYEEFI